MLKKQLEDKIIEQKDLIFELNRELFQTKQFVEIGDERLEKAMQRIEGYILKINKIKLCQKCQKRAK